MLTTGILALSMCAPTFAATSDLQTLKTALNEAQTTYESATNTKEKAKAAFEEQNSKTDSVLDDVRDLTGDELASKLDELKAVAEQTKSDYAAAVTPYNESLATLNGGAFSFFKWVAANYPGYADDANNAIAVLEKAQSLGYITDTNYSEDQTSFYSMKISERYMEDYVTLRTYVGIEYVPTTNLTAVADSMMSVGGAKATGYHYSDWLSDRGWDENLSFGYGVYGNYDVIYDGELLEVLNYTPNETVSEETIDYAETNSDDIVQTEETEILSEVETEEQTGETNNSETNTIYIPEEIEETASEQISNEETSEVPLTEPDTTIETTSTEIEPEEETESTAAPSEGESVEESIEESEEEILAVVSEDESETTTEVTYPTYDEWFAEEVANGMLNACPFLNKNAGIRSTFAGWYTREKYNYDLIQKYNYNNGDQVGHYYNLTRKRNAEIFAMAKKGTTYVLDMQTYYTTSDTSSSGLNYCTNYAAMSVSEYNSLLDAFYNSLNLKSQKDTLEGYKTTYQNAVAKIAYCKAKKTYEEASTAYETAKAALETARNNVISYVPYSPEVTLSNVNSGIQISWEAVDTAKMYYVYRKTDSTDWSMIGIGTTTTYIDRKATDGETYYYAVLTANQRKNRSDYLFANQKIMRVKNSLSVRQLYIFTRSKSGTANAECQIILNNTYDGEAELYRKEDDGSMTQIELTSDDFGPYFSISKANTTPNKSYTYYLKLVRDGYESTTKEFNITITDTIDNVVQTKIGNKMRLSWSSIKLADGQTIMYKVYKRTIYSTGKKSKWILQKTSRINSYTYVIPNSATYTEQYVVIPVTNNSITPTVNYN